jgi:hypothetical protein
MRRAGRSALVASARHPEWAQATPEARATEIEKDSYLPLVLLFFFGGYGGNRNSSR